jgi:hypothetical protein
MAFRVARLGYALVFAALSAAGEARAADPPTADSAAEARQQYQQGTKAFSGKKYNEAALHFESAAAFKASAIALYTAALAWDLANKPERAADAFSRALDVPGLDEKQTNTAKDRLATLENQLGTAQVSAPDGWKVQLDSFTEAPTPAKLHGATGSHTITIRTSSKETKRREVTLEAGKVEKIDLKEEPKPEPPKPSDLPETPSKPDTKPTTPSGPEALPPRLAHPFWTTPRVAGVGVAGLGVAGVIGGIILGLNANDAADAYKAAPTQPAFDHASSLQTWTNVTLIAGVVLIAGGIALVAIPIGGDSGERTMTANLNGFGGTF